MAVAIQVDQGPGFHYCARLTSLSSLFSSKPKSVCKCHCKIAIRSCQLTFRVTVELQPADAGNNVGKSLEGFAEADIKALAKD
jgi:hypothetical protein